MSSFFCVLSVGMRVCTNNVQSVHVYVLLQAAHSTQPHWCLLHHMLRHLNHLLTLHRDSQMNPLQVWNFTSSYTVWSCLPTYVHAVNAEFESNMLCMLNMPCLCSQVIVWVRINP